MADEVKLITFAGETVSPLYDGLMQELYTGGGGIITGAVVTIKDASTLHITGGYGALCGREFEIFASDIPVTLSSSGTLKGRLYLHMDLAQSGAPIELLVEVAASLTPVVQDSDVNTTNGVYEVNLATFDVGTSAISNLVDVSPKLSKIPDQISLLNSALTKYTLLWSNSNPTADFVAQRILEGVDLTQYTFILISTSNGDCMCKPGYIAYNSVFGTGGGVYYAFSRYFDCRVPTNGISVAADYRIKIADGTYDVANSNNIPITVYGVKIPT